MGYNSRRNKNIKLIQETSVNFMYMDAMYVCMLGYDIWAVFTILYIHMVCVVYVYYCVCIRYTMWYVLSVCDVYDGCSPAPLSFSPQGGRERLSLYPPS